MSIVPPSAADESRFIYLASASPRRRVLLQQLGLILEQLPAAVDESLHAGETVLAYTKRLSCAKASAGWRQLVASGKSARPVLAADTAVVCDGQILGKPRNEQAGIAMLDSLSGRWHQVVTAVALLYDNDCLMASSDTRVKFRDISPAEAFAYWRTGEPADKAGGYAIQGQGARFVERIKGSYTGVVGLPLAETEALLGRFSVKCGW